MTVEDWGWVNWYATRRHLCSEQTDYRGGKSLCGKADIETFESHAKRRAKWTDKPLDYDAIPKCKFCQRKASTA